MTSISSSYETIVDELVMSTSLHNGFIYPIFLLHVSCQGSDTTIHKTFDKAGALLKYESRHGGLTALYTPGPRGTMGRGRKRRVEGWIIVLVEKGP